MNATPMLLTLLLLPFVAAAADGAATSSTAQTQPAPIQQGPRVSMDIMPMSTAELSDRALLNTMREHLGHVEFIARNRDDGSLNAVVELAESDDVLVAVPLDRVHPRGNSLVMYSPVDRNDLALNAPYAEERFERIEADRIADVPGAYAPPQPPATTFSELDTDGDGLISRTEAGRVEVLQQRWEQADRNGDGQLDPAEFSAFESELPRAPEV